AHALRPTDSPAPAAVPPESISSSSVSLCEQAPLGRPLLDQLPIHRTQFNQDQDRPSPIPLGHFPHGAGAGEGIEHHVNHAASSHDAPPGATRSDFRHSGQRRHASPSAPVLIASSSVLTHADDSLA